MKIAVFNTKAYDRQFLTQANEKAGHQLTFFEPHLNVQTALLASGFEAVCVFVNDMLNAPTVDKLASLGVKVVLLRCAGYNNVDLVACAKHGITVLRVPAYSTRGVAEHAVALMLSLNRKIHRANNRVHDGNFTLDGLLGFEMYGQTVGIIGTGRIGLDLARIMVGFGCKVIAYDAFENPQAKEAGVTYVPLETLFKESDIISLHVPLMPTTHHIINEKSISLMKKGVMIINTSRGGLIDTAAVIEALKIQHIGYLGLDVYEEEEELFFEDRSGQVIHDDIFARLTTFPSVLITAHQAFFTRNALVNIAQTTLSNATDYANKRVLVTNLVK